MIIEIPLRSDIFSYEFQINLDQELFTLKFRFNQRLNFWIMDIMDDIGVDIISGVPLLTNVNLIKNHQCRKRPKGEFTIIDELGTSENASLYNLGSRFKLIYKEYVDG
jgi:hypothetical protein